MYKHIAAIHLLLLELQELRFDNQTTNIKKGTSVPFFMKLTLDSKYKVRNKALLNNGRMMELVDMTDLKSVGPKGRAGSTPAPATKLK
jgi:hypothetical protein